MTNAEIIQRLIEARQKLSRGWCQGFLHQIDDYGNEKWCLSGALLIGDTLVDYDEISGALNRVIRMNSIPVWNDARGRTQQEVLDLVDRTIASLMEVEAPEVAKTREELVEA